jgi:hypothetical protein
VVNPQRDTLGRYTLENGVFSRVGANRKQSGVYRPI